MNEYMIGDQYSDVGKILPTKKGNNFIVKFSRIGWLLLNNKYWKEIGQKSEKKSGFVPKFIIMKDYEKIGIGIIRISKYDKKEPYLHLIKYRKNTMNGIAGKNRDYFIFDLDDDLNPKKNSPVRAKIFSKTYY